MHPRLYMQSFQYAIYNPDCGIITFETRRIDGRRAYFDLTKNEFFDLNDVLILIARHKAHGHFPLGCDNIWFQHDKFHTRLYKDKDASGRAYYFNFISFEEYSFSTHHRLLSLIRLKAETPTVTRQRVRGRRRQQQSRDGRGECDIKPASHKRPLSIAVQSPDRSPPSKRARGREREAASRTPDHVIVSDDDKTSAVFSKWNHSNPGRWSDSISSTSSISQSVLSPAEVRLNYPTNEFDKMES